MKTETGTPVLLEGHARERGLAQARLRPDLTDAVKSAIKMRLDGLNLDADALDYLAQQQALSQRLFPEQVAELDGIAEGFGLAGDDLFTYLHAAVLEDRGRGVQIHDGCSALALAHRGCGPLLGKNRDYRGEHAQLQAVFRHQGADIATGAMICVGSFGSPGAFSSGINGRGLAIVDTQVPTRDHGVGALRYLLMTWLLSEADSVERALEMIASVPHAGGGNLVLADPSGARAAVELGHRGTTVERAECDWIARTNHYLSAPLCDSHPEGPLDSIGASSRGRLAHIREVAPGLPDSDGLAPVAALFASHDSDGRTGLCSHPVGDGPRTISTSLYLCRDRALCFSDGNPCLDRWYRFQLA